MPRIPRPLILSGGPAAGKSTRGRALAAACDRAAFIDVDDIRQLVVAGDHPLWQGPEGNAQAELAAVNTSSLATNFLAAGFAVVIADYITAATLAVYRVNLPECFVVHLRISPQLARKRAATRALYITDDEFELLHAAIATPPSADVILDVDRLSAAEQIEVIRTGWLNSASE